MVRLSNSAVNKYILCPKEYELHYLRGYRSKFTSSPLIFGSALDVSLEHYIINKDFGAALKLFQTTWQIQKVNEVETDLRFLVSITYSNKDLDLDLLDEKDFASINFECGKGSSFTIDDLIAKKKDVGFQKLTKKEKKILNYTTWLSLKKKGELMLAAAKEIIDENLVELLGTQIKVEFENEDGDTAIGYADFAARWKGYDKPILFDFKTSSIDYEKDSVQTSPQLSGYVYALQELLEGSKLGGYIVLHKNIVKQQVKICEKCGNDGTGARHKTCEAIIDTKRCNGAWQGPLKFKVKTQVIIDEIPEATMEQTMNTYNEVGELIKAGEFPQNHDSCIRFYTQKCAYFEYCRTGSTKDIEMKKDKPPEQK